MVMPKYLILSEPIFFTAWENVSEYAELHSPAYHHIF